MLKWRILRTKRYIRAFKKLPPDKQERVRRAEIELASSDDPRRLGHPLKGRWRGAYAYHVERNLIIIYSVRFKALILELIQLGTHKNYYRW